jgi:hypothetical protein
MNLLIIYLKILLSTGLNRIFFTFIQVFGFIWLLLDPLLTLIPGAQAVGVGWQEYILLVAFSILGSLILKFPRRSVSKSMVSPESTIEIKVGDLFHENAHLVVGTNDCFDTELGDVIKKTSVQGQFLSRIYDGDQTRLDSDINQLLTETEIEPKADSEKQKGKNLRYPIGTALALGNSGKYYFLLAYGQMNNEAKCVSSIDDIWNSLSSLWERVRSLGQAKPIAMPIIGSDLARTGLPREILVELIILSFITASKEEFVTKKLTIMVHPDDVSMVNLHNLKDFLGSAVI